MNSLRYSLPVNLRSLLPIIPVLLLLACTGPRLQVQPESSPQIPLLTEDAMIMQDGYRLPLRRWEPAGRAKAVVLALHGFNDYSNAFASTARALSQHSIALYAIDQRGFGRSANTGLWSGRETMRTDLIAATRLLCASYPETPLVLMGESMGGAVILDASQALHSTCASGVILSAPAVWGWQTMPWWQGALLKAAAHVLPAMKLTGEGLDIRPSDNIEMLRALGRDPLVIKETRIDTIYGLTNLMQAAFDESEQLHLPTLLLYGEHDEIITPLPMCGMLEKIGDFTTRRWRMLLYPDGFHMLTRDLQAEVVLRDISSWIRHPDVAVPSAYEVDMTSRRLAKLCGRHALAFTY